MSRKLHIEHRITILYLIIGAVWILFSDYAVNLISNNPELIRQLQTYKGWFFVLCTATLLFFYIKKHSQQVRTINRRYKALYDKAPLSYHSIDKDGIITDINPYWCNTLGYDKQEAIGKPFVDFIHADYRKKFKKALKELQQHNSISNLQLQLNKKDGTSIIVSMEASKGEYNQNQTLQYFCTFKNITDAHIARREIIKAKNKAEESNQLIKTFLNNISHEIRTPMNSILGFSQMLIRDQSTSEKKELYKKQIQQSCNTLLDKITDAIDIARVESGHIKVYNDHVNIAELINNNVVHYKQYTKDKVMLKVNNHLPTDKQIAITDEYKLSRIIKHLIDNALKYTKAGNITVEMTFTEKHNHYQIRVTDTGQGIDYHAQKKIFDPFVQAKPSEKNIESGTGIGLSITKAFVQLINGKMEMDSQPGKGTSITISLPANLHHQ